MLATIIPLIGLMLIVWVLGAVLWSMRGGKRQSHTKWLPYPVINASEEEMPTARQPRDRSGKS
jgi:hypothetical protein